MKKFLKIFLMSIILIIFVTPSLFLQEIYAQNNDFNDNINLNKTILSPEIQGTISTQSSSNFEMDSELQYSDIDEAISAFEETVNQDEWYEWFDSLTPEQQNSVNYRPSNFFEKQQTTDEVVVIAEPILPEKIIDTINIIVNQDESIAMPPSQDMSSGDNIPTPIPTLTPTPIPFIDNLSPNTQTTISDFSVYVNDSFYCSIDFVKATSSSITVSISFYSTSNIYNKISYWDPFRDKWIDQYYAADGLPQAYNGTYTFNGLSLNGNYRVFVSTWDTINNQWRDCMLTVPTSLPLSGNEREYNPSYWNQELIIKNANCYTYALGYSTENGKNPGNLAGINFNQWDLNADTINSRIQEDGKKLYESNIANRSDCWNEVNEFGISYNGYKVAMVIDPGKDYHFYRQNSDGYWSHKRGITEVINIDASGERIANPKTCNRNYINNIINYSEFCGFYAYNARN